MPPPPRKRPSGQPDRRRPGGQKPAGATSSEGAASAPKRPGKPAGQKAGGAPSGGAKPGGPKAAGRKPFGRKSGGGKPGGGKRGGPERRTMPGVLTVQKLEGQRYVLVAPRCAQQRDMDLDDVIAMQGEEDFDAARDELLYLVEDCRGFLEAYNILGELALEDQDIPLAQGHFGFGFENGLAALPEGFRGQLPVNEGYNRHFFAAGRGLACCLATKGDLQQAREVLEKLLTLDPEESESRTLLNELLNPPPADDPPLLQLPS